MVFRTAKCLADSRDGADYCGGVDDSGNGEDGMKVQEGIMLIEYKG